MSPQGPGPPNRNTEPALAQVGGYLIGPAFVLLAIVFVAVGGAVVPTAPTPSVAPVFLDISPRREAMGDPPRVEIAGFDQRCNACHKLFASSWDGSRPLLQHTHISLEHGINNECNNCHAREDRERLVLHDESTVGFADSPRLCSQCHGPLYRDWLRGVHGKTLGYWDGELGESRRLTCAECHDPHSPAYEDIAPLPGPNTLRMGASDHEFRGELESERNPLRLWSDVGAEGTGEDHEEGGDH